METMEERKRKHSQRYEIHCNFCISSFWTAMRVNHFSEKYCWHTGSFDVVVSPLFITYGSIQQKNMYNWFYLVILVLTVIDRGVS